MRFKFNCPTCGQRISAEPDQYHTTAPCPTCGVDLLVPTPTVPLRGAAGELPALIKRLERMGFTYTRSTDPVDSAQEFSRLQDALHAFKDLDDLIEKLSSTSKITRLPTTEEKTAIRTKLFSHIMHGVFGGAEEEMETVIFSVVPALRAKEQNPGAPSA